MLLPIKDDNSYLDEHERQARGRWKPYMTYMLIAVNVGAFIFEIIVTGQFVDFVNGRALQLFYEWGAVPQCIMGADTLTLNFGSGTFSVECPNNPLFTLVSSTFLHGGILHLGGNMLFLWIFGDNIEYRFGRFKYLGIYLAWGVLAGLAHVAGDFSSVIPAVGASGAVSGILGAYLVLFPRARILTVLMLFFFWRMMHIQARWFLPFWLVFQNLLPFFVGGFGVAGGGVAYLAHIGGFAVGLAVGYLYKKMFYREPTYGTRYGYRPDDYR